MTHGPSAPQPVYHPARKARAGRTMTLRVLVCLYFLYLAWQIASGGASGTSPIPQWGVVALTAAFAAVAVGFGYYAWWRYRSDLKAAELTEEERRELGAES